MRLRLDVRVDVHSHLKWFTAAGLLAAGSWPSAGRGELDQYFSPRFLIELLRWLSVLMQASHYRCHYCLQISS